MLMNIGNGVSRVKSKPPDMKLPIWRTPDGEPVSCAEKIKVLNENLQEIRELAQEALEDALLMGCDEGQVRDVMRQLVDALRNPYRK
jgi:hypothetical protein